MRWRALPRASALALAVVAAAPTGAWAAGISAARFGGEHGHPTTSNPTAIYYNPAGIALARGTHIFLDASLALRSVEYDRPVSMISNQGVSQDALAANSGGASVFNPLVGPFAGVSSDFGTDWISAGVAWYYPFGGQSIWDQNSDFDGDSRFPGAVDGTQRWYSIDGTIRSMYLTGALAFNIRDWNLSIGVSGSAIRSEVNTIRARNTDGSDDLTADGTDDGPLKEGRSQIDVSGWQGGFGVGLIWQPLPDELWLGLSYQSQPGVSGGMTLKGTLQNALSTGPASKTDVELQQAMPDVVRFGTRYRPFADWEFRLFGDYTRWSVLDRQCLRQTGVPRDDNGNVIAGPQSCNFGGLDDARSNPGGVTFRAEKTTVDGQEFDTTPATQHLVRKWVDSFGLRLGASYWAIPELEIYLGLGFDSNAIPDETLDPAITDADKVSVAAGTRWQIVENLGMAFTFTQLIYFERDTAGRAINNQFPTGINTRQPGNGGVYNQMISVFNLYADISF
jgi:long-chain fatty acid transport protein